MNKASIVEILEEKHENLFSWLANQPDDKWMTGPDGKWTLGQHIAHLVNSEKILNKAMNYPGFLLKYKYGVANRAPRSYDEVAKRYEDKLNDNLDRAKQFNRDLQTPTLAHRAALIETLSVQNKKLQNKVSNWADKKLDTLILPHPLMGRMPIRELLMWTAHHTEHHTKTLKTNY